MNLAVLGPLVGSLARPLGGKLSRPNWAHSCLQSNANTWVTASAMPR